MPTNNGLIQRFQNLFARPTPTPGVVSEIPATMVDAPNRPMAMSQLFSTENNRRAAIKDCRQMFDEDTRAPGVIKALARDTVKSWFELRIDGPRADEARKIADDVIKRVQLQKRLEGWTVSTLRDGDTFLELIANSAGDIVDISRKPTLEMHRWSNEFDIFHDPSQAFFWTDHIWNGIEAPANATYFAEWQIIHARSDHDENSRYGRPLFFSARKAYKRVSEGELDVSIRRKTRSGMRYLHALEDASEADIERYKTRNKSVLSDPFAAIADFFSSKKTSISTVQGDAQLQEIGDVEHHIHTWWVASPIPMALLGYGKDLNRDILEEQKEQYDASKESLSAWLTEEIVRPLIERQWLLKGIWPDSLEWSVEWAGKDSLTAAGLKTAGEAIVILNNTGKFTDETLLRLFSRFVPEFDAEAEIEALEQLREQEMRDEMRRIAENARRMAEQNRLAAAQGVNNEGVGDQAEGSAPAPVNGRVPASAVSRNGNSPAPEAV